MKVKLFVVGDMQENTYFIIDKKLKECIVIDPGSEPDVLIEYIKKKDLILKYIVLTHAHFDHIGACNNLKKEFNVPIVIANGEEDIIKNCENNLSVFYGDNLEIDPDIILSDFDTLSFANFNFLCISTPGHTPGSACFYFEKQKIIFTGDTLFYETIGRTDFSYSDTNKMLESIKKLKNLPKETVVYPGHGKKTSIEHEIKNNIYMI